MAGVAYTPSGNWPDLNGTAGQGPLLIPQDGDLLTHNNVMQSSTGNLGLIAKLIDGCQWLYNTIATFQTTYAQLSGVNSFTGALTMTTASILGVNGSFGRGAQSISAATTAVFLASTSPSLVIADAWAGYGGVLTVTLPTNPGAGNWELEVVFHPVANGAVCYVLQSGGYSATITGTGSVRVRWNGSNWKFIGSSSVGGGASVVVTVP